MPKHKTTGQYIEEYVQRLKRPDLGKMEDYSLRQLFNFVDPEIPYQTEVLYKDLIFKHEYLLHKEIFIKYSDLDELTPLCLKLFHSWVHYHKTPFHKPWKVWDVLNLRNFAFKHNCPKFWYYYRWQISVWMQHKKCVRKGYTEQILQLIPEMYYVNYYSWYKHFNQHDKLASYIKYSSYEILRIDSGIIKFLKDQSYIADQNVISSFIAMANIEKFDFTMLSSEPIEGICIKAWKKDFRMTRWELFQHPRDLHAHDSIPAIYFSVPGYNYKKNHISEIFKLSLILPVKAANIFYSLIQPFVDYEYITCNFYKIREILSLVTGELTINRETSHIRKLCYKTLRKIETIENVKYLDIYNFDLSFFLNKIPRYQKAYYHNFVEHGIVIVKMIALISSRHINYKKYSNFINLEILKKYS